MSRVITLAGVILIILHACGVSTGAVSLFELGVGICFAASLVGAYWPRHSQSP